MRVIRDHTRRARGYYWIRVRHNPSGNPPLMVEEGKTTDDDWQVCYWDDDNETWHPITFAHGIPPDDVEAVNKARIRMDVSRSRP
jgi:hypothetical protein